MGAKLYGPGGILLAYQCYTRAEKYFTGRIGQYWYTTGIEYLQNTF